MSIHGLIITSILALLFLALPIRAEAASLEELVAQYSEAKKGALRAPTTKRGKGTKRGKAADDRGAAEILRRIDSILAKIARLKTGASRKYLAKEYARVQPQFAAAVAVALISTGEEKAIKTAARGFDRGRRWSITGKVRVLDALAESGGESGLDHLLEFVRRGKPDIQTIAMGSLANQPESSRALDGLIGGLEHRSPQVRAAALRGITKFRQHAMVPALIRRIEKEKAERLRVDALQILVDVTGHNMGLVAADWLKWWELAEKTFELKKPSKGSTRVASHDLEYFGIEISSKRIAFLVDASKSMQGSASGGGRRGKKGGGKKVDGDQGARKSKIDALKKELTRILGKLPDTSWINIIAFHRTYVPWQKELRPLRGKGRASAVEFTQNLTLELKTNIYDSLEFALKDRSVDTIYLLSDGRPVGGKFTQPADILREIGAINRLRGVTIHCISFGKETNFLIDLAAQNGGDYRAIGGGGKRKKRR